MCNSGIFWGILVVVFGGGILIKNIFKLDISVFSIVLGAALVLIGIKLLVCPNHLNIFNHNSSGKNNNVIFGNRTFLYNENQKEYNIIFSSASLDFTQIDKSPEYPIVVSCVFGEMKLFINPKTKILIDSDVIFGKIDNPYEINEDWDSIKAAPIKLTLKANAVFGNIKIIREASKSKENADD